jgi:5-methylcytosine-specific restriction endonuclease McrBC regulatory subunit McrC
LIRRFEPHVTFKTLNRRLFDCLSFNRLNQHYEPLIEVCWFIFTTLNIYQQGDGKFFDIADDKLSKLFENFLRNYLAQSLSEDGYVVSASQVNHWLITPEGERPRYMPSIKPDIVIKRKGRVEFVIDAKFYKTPVHASHVGKTDNNETEARQKTHSHNLYQIIAYTSYFNCDGLLVYAQTDSGFFYEMVTINKKNYPGNIIETPYFGFYTLSLSGEFEQFKKRLKEFVDTIVLAQISA